MKNSVKRLFSLMIITVISCAPTLAANYSKTSATVESSLRQSLQLPMGPATQFVTFHIPKNGLFIVVTTDFSMRTSVATPFGPAKSKGSAPGPATIRKALKNAILLSRKLQLPRGNNESLFIILVNRALFSRPGAEGSHGITYKAYIPIQRLISGNNPAASIVME